MRTSSNRTLLCLDLCVNTNLCTMFRNVLSKNVVGAAVAQQATFSSRVAARYPLSPVRGLCFDLKPFIQHTQRYKYAFLPQGNLLWRHNAPLSITTCIGNSPYFCRYSAPAAGAGAAVVAAALAAAAAAAAQSPTACESMAASLESIKKDLVEIKAAMKVSMISLLFSRASRAGAVGVPSHGM